MQGEIFMEFLPQNIPSHYMETAEQIRSYLVSIRGGAPFLSSTDGQILVEWLDSSISPAIICSVIDNVSLRRRKKRVKTRLTLHVCRGELNKMFTKTKSTKDPDPSVLPVQEEQSPMQKFKDQVLSENLPSQVHPLRTIFLQILDDVDAVQKSHSHVFDLKKRKHEMEAVMQRVIAILVQIHEQIYEATIDEHEILQSQAEIELSSLRTILPPVQWRDAVDEVVRDTLRQRFPSLRVGKVWDVINHI